MLAPPTAIYTHGPGIRRKSKYFLAQNQNNVSECRGGFRGGGHPARAPPKIGKNMIFWRKIVIFNTKYPKNFRTSLRSMQFF
jgi:hypothetical protein